MVCRICKGEIRGRYYALRTGATHRDCRRMQTRGLLRTGGVAVAKDSTGLPCNGCGDLIEGPHAHRRGNPYHRECLL